MRAMPAAALAVAVLAAGCTGPAGSDAQQPPAQGATPPVVGTPTQRLDGPLRLAWSLQLDGEMYARPLVAGSLAVAATENNTVYAVDLASGRLAWRRHLESPARRSELPCGNIDPSGITGTPAYDASTGLVFVATETHGARHTLYALDGHTGRTRWQRSLDVVPGRDPLAEQQRGALLVTAGRVYVPFGGRFGDCGNYVGYIAALPIAGHGPVLRYAVPTAREGGIWAAGGAVVGPGRDLYAATGNGAEVGDRYDGSDSVIRLSTSLARKAFFSPETWRDDNAQDLDLGSMSPVVTDGMVVIAGKRGRVFLLPAALGGIGGDIAHVDGCAGYGSGAARGDIVVLPCDGGLRALRITGTRLRWLWRKGGLHGSPMIADEQGFAFDGADLARFDLTSGAVRARMHVGDVTRFTSPAAAGSLILVGTRARLLAVKANAP